MLELELSEVFKEDIGEEVTLHGDEDETITVLVDEPQNFSGDDEQAEIRTTFHIDSSEGSKLEGLAEVTIRGFRWHVGEPLPPNGGLVAVPVRRKFEENTRTNTFDLNDEQAIWNS